MADADVEATPADDNDDSWLYGDAQNESREGKVPETTDKVQSLVHADAQEETAETDQAENENEAEENEDSHFNDEHFAEVDKDQHDQTNGDEAIQDHADSDSDDSDDVKVTIGDIKSSSQAYASLNIKRGGLVAAGSGEKTRTGPTAGKVTLEDLDGPGSINGVPALEFNIDTIEDKPWNKPGADISDYFNYGFNEVTWSAYCERQRRMRVNEAGVGLHVGPPPRAPPPDLRRMQGPPRSDDGMQSPMTNNYQVRENTIQVMTAERREYGRGALPRDLAPPPADYFVPPPDHYYPPPHQPYDEPWGHPEQSGWAPNDIKELTPGPMGAGGMGPPAGLAPPGVAPAGAPPPGPHLMPAPYGSPYRPHLHPHAPHLHDRERDRDRPPRDIHDRDRRDRDRRDDEDRERERSRSIKPDRIREKSYRRERSRSRSRRHKSRSRSPRARESRELRDRSRDRERDRDRERERDRSRDRERSPHRERSLKPKSKESKENKEDDK